MKATSELPRLAPPRLTLLLSLFFLAGLGIAQNANGTWQGAIDIPGMSLEVSVEITATPSGWNGTVDIPAQGASDLPLEDVNVSGSDVAFAIDGVPGEPEFRGTIDEDTMTGTFSQSDKDFPFELTRGSADTFAGRELVEYSDPQGRFSFPYPESWSVAEEEGLVTATGPEGVLRVHFHVADEEDPVAAIESGWSLVESDVEPVEPEITYPPVPQGVSTFAVADYDFAAHFVQAFAQVVDGEAYVVLIDASREQVQRRGAQLNIVALGLDIAGVADTDLSEMEQRPLDLVLPAFEAFLNQAVETLGVPGATVSIVQEGSPAYTGAVGFRDHERELPMTPETRLMIGSTGKTLTSLLVATLVDEGVLDWDTPVQQVLPQFEVADPELSETITMRDLLCACTGVPRRDLELFFNANELGAQEIIESLASFEFFTDFGEAFQYSNQLVATAGYAASAADGASYGELYEGYARSLNTRVLEPAGMNSTTLDMAQVLAGDNFASPHYLDIFGAGFSPLDPELEEPVLAVAPAGAHWSTAEDSARYMAMQLASGVTPEGERIVSERNLAVTREPQVSISANLNYALGWIAGEVMGLTTYSHGGNTLGFTSEIILFPEVGLGVTVLTNAQSANDLASVVTSRLLELLYDRPDRSSEQLRFAADRTNSVLEQMREDAAHVDPVQVQAFLGEYRNAALGELSLELEKGRLYLVTDEFRSELLRTENGYSSAEPPLTGLLLQFEMEDGEPVVVVGEAAVSYRFQRVQ